MVGNFIHILVFTFTLRKLFLLNEGDAIATHHIAIVVLCIDICTLPVCISDNTFDKHFYSSIISTLIHVNWRQLRCSYKKMLDTVRLQKENFKKLSRMWESEIFLKEGMVRSFLTFNTYTYIILGNWPNCIGRKFNYADKIANTSYWKENTILCRNMKKT